MQTCGHGGAGRGLRTQPDLSRWSLGQPQEQRAHFKSRQFFQTGCDGRVPQGTIISSLSHLTEAGYFGLRI